MKRIALLSKDGKVTAQAELWLRDLPEEVGLEKFDSYDAFVSVYPKAPSAPADAPASPASAVDSEEPIAPLAAVEDAPDGANAHRDPVHLLIADLEILGADPLARLREARQILLDSVGIDSKSPLAVLAMAYESAGAASGPAVRDPVRAFRNECVDDLILKPLDRSLFLQKVEILTAGNPAAPPSFLFRQKTSVVIEMGKETTVERIGESGFAIRNPTPLVDGLFARAYCSLFGEGMGGSIYGRAYRNERHPQYPGESLVYFSFFGATHDQLQRVRKFAKAQAGFRARGAGAARSKQAPLAQAKAVHPIKNVIIIDVDPFAAAQLSEALETNFENIKTHRFPSYSSFLAHLKMMGIAKDAAAKNTVPAVPASANAAAELTPAAPAAPAPPRAIFPGHRSQSFVLLASNLDIASVDPALAMNEEAFGIPGKDYAERPGAWLDAFSSSDKESLREFAAVIAGGRSAGRTARVQIAGAATAYIEIKGRRDKAADGEGEARLRFDMREIDQAAYARLQPAKTRSGDLPTVDGVFIDGGLIPEDPSAWHAGLTGLLEKAGLGGINAVDPSAAPPGAPVARTPVIVLGDEGVGHGPARFRAAEIRDFIYRPLDRRLVVEKAEVAIAGLIPKKDAPPVEFHVCSAPAKVVKDVLVEEFSEYGALIKHQTPLRDDAFVALYSSVFGDQHETPIWARCTYCAKAGEDESYHCLFRFFGIGEDALQRIRSWIREDYVAKKEPA